MNMDLCIFCEIINRKNKSRKIYETEYTIALLDAFPLKEGHILIISKAHKTKVQELDKEENNDIFSTLHFLTNHIKKIDKPTPIHTMFKKEKLSEAELDKIWKKMTQRIQQQS